MQIGRVQDLPVWTVGAAGVLLGDRRRHVILPPNEAPEGAQKGDRVRVFVYTDRDGQPAATTRTPAGEVGDIRVLEVVGANDHGVFCDLGVGKDLFVPWKLQHTRLRLGDRAVVYIGLDRDGRLVGHTKLVDLLGRATDEVKVGQEVRLLVYGSNEAGVLVVVDGTWAGIVYRDRLHGGVGVGEERTGYVERVREDGKLDISPVPVGRGGTDHAVDAILQALREEGGFLPLTDNSAPELIRRRLGLSKKAFKKGVGALYRQRRVTLEPDGIRATG